SHRSSWPPAPPCRLYATVGALPSCETLETRDPDQEKSAIVLHRRQGACGMGARVPDPPRLPEEFEPTSPPLSRFRILPPPPLRPRLFPDEARFALRLSILAGCTELAAWAWLARAGVHGAVLGWAAARLLRPVWSWLGTRLPRPAVAFALVFLGLAGTVASL